MLTPIDYMRNFCCAAIPAVYDSSLTFYEVLTKLQNKLNEAITVINQNVTDIKTLNKSVTGSEDGGELNVNGNYLVFGVDDDDGTPMLEFDVQTYTVKDLPTKIANDNTGNRTLAEKLNGMRNDITTNENGIAENKAAIAKNKTNTDKNSTNISTLNTSMTGNSSTGTLSVQTKEWLVDSSTGKLKPISDTITNTKAGISQANSSMSQIANRVNYLLDNNHTKAISWNNFSRGIMVLVPETIPSGFGFTADNVSKYLSNIGANVPAENVSIFNFGTYITVQSLCSGAAAFLSTDSEAKLTKDSISALYVFGTGGQDTDTSTTVAQLKAQVPEDCSIVLLPDGWFNIPINNYALSYNALGVNVVYNGYQYLIGTDANYSGVACQAQWVMMDLMFNGASNRHTEYGYYFDPGSGGGELKATLKIDGNKRVLSGFNSTTQSINNGEYISPFYGSGTTSSDFFFTSGGTSCSSTTATYEKTDGSACGQMYINGNIGLLFVHYNPPTIGEYSLYDLNFELFI